MDNKTEYLHIPLYKRLDYLKKLHVIKNEKESIFQVLHETKCAQKYIKKFYKLEMIGMRVEVYMYLL